MKLYYSINSPYARKCRVVVFETKLENRIKWQLVDPHQNPPELLAANPLGKVPTLVTGSGNALCDSTVICEYLDNESQCGLYPAGKERFKALALAAIADGMTDMAVELILQKRRPKDQQWPDWIAKREQGIIRAAAVVEKQMEGRETPLNIGHITLACALAYVDFRHPEVAWRNANPRLADWVDAFKQRPSMQATLPAA